MGRDELDENGIQFKLVVFSKVINQAPSFQALGVLQIVLVIEFDQTVFINVILGTMRYEVLGVAGRYQKFRTTI